MPKRLRLTRRFTVAMTNDAHRSLFRFAEDGGISAEVRVGDGGGMDHNGRNDFGQCLHVEHLPEPDAIPSIVGIRQAPPWRDGM